MSSTNAPIINWKQKIFDLLHEDKIKQLGDDLYPRMYYRPNTLWLGYYDYQSFMDYLHRAPGVNPFPDKLVIYGLEIVRVRRRKYLKIGIKKLKEKFI